MNRICTNPRGSRQWRRRGVTIVECAVCSLTLFVLIFGSLELSLATFRANVLSEGARRLARDACIRGAMAPSEVPTWGPEEYTGNAADDHEIARVVRRVLPTIDPEDVQISVAWPDGDNRPQSRVRVQLAYRHEWITGLGVTSSGIDLSAQSVLTIIN